MKTSTDLQLVQRADLIVTGTVLDATSREIGGRMIVTDYRLQVEQVLKGSERPEIVTITEHGGFVNGHGVLIPGSARYTPGMRVLTFLRRSDKGTWFTANMALGRFAFERAGDGTEILTRDDDGVEVESADAFAARPAGAFLRYVRNAANGIVTEVPKAATQSGRNLTPRTEAPASAYVFKHSDNVTPIRWNCEVSCGMGFAYNGIQNGLNQAQTESGITTALSAWGLDLTLNGQTATTSFPDDDLANENDIIVNYAGDFSADPICDGGLACAYIHYNPVEHTYKGETFWTVEEADIAVSNGALGETAFEAIVAHEAGHALSIRHSNAGSPSSGNALMNSSVPTDLGASLRAWDQDAVNAVYGADVCTPPNITSVTGSGNVPQGFPTTLEVVATGTAPLSYQWYSGAFPDLSTPVGTNSSLFTTPPVNSTQQYWVKVLNQCNFDASATITLTPEEPAPCDPPVITTDPQSQRVAPGGTATLNVAAIGTQPFIFRWFEGNAGDMTKPVGTNSSQFQTPALTSQKKYWVRVENDCGHDNSLAATIDVGTQCVAVLITSQPASQTINVGASATFSVGVSGDSPFTYQWFQGETNDLSQPIGGATSASLTVGPMNTSGAFKFWVRVTNACGEAPSTTATLTVGACAGPAITIPPASQSVPLGGSITLGVAASGDAPFTYQWYEGETGDTTKPVAGATGPTLARGPLNTLGTFRYWAKVNNACGEARSATAVITVVCSGPAPELFAPPVAPNALSYEISWAGDLGATPTFRLEESTNSSFTSGVRTFIVPAVQFTIPAHTEITSDTRFWYRVAGILACNGTPTDFSAPSSTVVAAPLSQNGNEFTLAVPAGSVQLLTQNYLVPGFGEEATAGDTFTIRTDAPFLSVFPPSGALSAGGTTVQMTFDLSILGVGSTNATMTVSRIPGASPAGSPRTQAVTPAPSPIPISISLVTPVTPSPRDANAPEGTLLIPAVAHADGLGARFQSDIRIANASNEAIKYEVSFTPSGTNGLQNGKMTVLTIASNETKGLDDVVKGWFGAGILNEAPLGTLEIRPLSTASGGIPNALSTFASSRTYAITQQGTLGQFIPGVPLKSFIGSLAQDSLAKLSLQQIANSAVYRTNLGFVEGSGNQVNLNIKLFDAAGTLLKQVPMTLGPLEHKQSGWAAVFGNTEVADGRIEVEVTSSTGKATAYASVIDNNTTDPLMVFPVQANKLLATKYVVPGIAELNAASNFHSDMRIFNPTGAPISLTLSYRPQAGETTPVPPSVTISAPAGKVTAIDNVLPTVFGLNGTGGAVTVTAANNTSLVITARTFSREADGGTYGQFIPAVTSADAVGAGERGLEVLQLEDSQQYRSNLGMVEVTGNPVRVELTLRPPDSKFTGVVAIDLGANEFRQIGRVFESLGIGPTYNGRVTMRVIEGQGRVAGYGSVVDNRTADPTYVPTQ